MSGQRAATPRPERWYRAVWRWHFFLWWRRRPSSQLGAPPSKGPLRHSWTLVGLVVLLGC